MNISLFSFFFFFNDTATTEIYTLSLHDALPIRGPFRGEPFPWNRFLPRRGPRSEEHTSELQSRGHRVCRLLLEKKKDHDSPAPGDINKKDSTKHPSSRYHN